MGIRGQGSGVRAGAGVWTSNARGQDLRPDGWEGVPNLGKAILGNETRLGVLVEVAMGIGRATPIAERLGVERCDVSKHMGVLFHSGLVRASPEDTRAYVLSPHVRVRRDATGVDIVVTADNGLELRVAVTTGEE